MRETLSQIAVGLALLGVPTMITGAAAQSAAAVVGTDEVRANVETVDQQKRMILLRGPTGALLTVHAGPEIRTRRAGATVISA